MRSSWLANVSALFAPNYFTSSSLWMTTPTFPSSALSDPDSEVDAQVHIAQLSEINWTKVIEFIASNRMCRVLSLDRIVFFKCSLFASINTWTTQHSTVWLLTSKAVSNNDNLRFNWIHYWWECCFRRPRLKLNQIAISAGIIFKLSAFMVMLNEQNKFHLAAIIRAWFNSTEIGSRKPQKRSIFRVWIPSIVINNSIIGSQIHADRSVRNLHQLTNTNVDVAI